MAADLRGALWDCSSQTVAVWLLINGLSEFSCRQRLSLVSFPPPAYCLCSPSVHHLFPSNSGDKEQHAPYAALSQRAVVQL